MKKHLSNKQQAKELARHQGVREGMFHGGILVFLVMVCVPKLFDLYLLIIQATFTIIARVLGV